MEACEVSHSTLSGLKRVSSHVTPEKREFAKQLRKRTTHTEKLLWERLRSRQLYGRNFQRQIVLWGWIVDFYCASEKLAVEVDGPYHLRRKKQDRFRDKVLKSHGIETLRVKNKDVITKMGEVLEWIASYFS